MTELVLGIETTGRLTGAALARGGELIAESSLAVDASSQEWLLGLVRELLDRHQLGVSDLGRIAVSIGPGSFTGIRVGLAAAKALAWGTGLPLVPVPTHQALALPWRDTGDSICLLTSHRRGLVCLEVGSWREARWSARIPASAVPVETLEARLLDALVGAPDSNADDQSRAASVESSATGLESSAENLDSRAADAPSNALMAGSLLFVGEAVESILAAVPSLRSLGRPLVDPLTRARRPGPVALLGSVLDPVPTGEIDRIEPLYLRDADATKQRS